jgi:AAA-like domain/WD domain, G-beta repeat
MQQPYQLAAVYQAGGSLPLDAPTYVMRQADEVLFQSLMGAEPCYVFNSRQMGKSSLRVRTMQRLRQENVRCAAVDLTAIGIQQVTPEQWYASIAAIIVESFGLPVSLSKWWREQEPLSWLQRLEHLIREVLLREIQVPIVIFIDEVDSVLGLPFLVDDFFSLIRHCYEQRTLEPNYGRLTFVLLGVATPGMLLQGRSATPFNIGRSIELEGFQWVEAMPLLKGLEHHIDPKTLLRQILSWSGGQPFLTQKLCALVAQSPPDVSVESLVQNQIIDNWESHDHPEHLRTIGDRILLNPTRLQPLLKLYQRLLLSPRGELSLDASSEQRELLLSGLLKQQQGRLVVKNPIYEAVFDLEWIDRHLPQPLPSPPPAITQLVPPQPPATGSWRSKPWTTLSQSARRGIIGGAIALGLLLSGLVALTAKQHQENRQLRTQLFVSSLSQAQAQLPKSPRAAILALLKADQLRQQLNQPLDPYRQDYHEILLEALPSGELRQSLPDLAQGITAAAFQPDGQHLAAASQQGTVVLWDQDGNLLQRWQLAEPLTTLAWSSDSQMLIVGSNKGRAWRLALKKSTWQPIGSLTQSALTSLAWQPESKTLLAVSDLGEVNLWRWENDRKFNLYSKQFLPAAARSNHTVTFHPLNRSFALGGAEGVSLWKADGQAQTQLLTSPTSAIDWDPKGEKLAMAVTEKITTGANVLPFVAKVLAWSPEGEKLALVGLDNRLGFWTQTGGLQEVVRLPETPRQITFSPNGAQLLVIYGDRPAQLISLALLPQIDQNLKAACRWLKSPNNPPLSQAEALLCS